MEAYLEFTSAKDFLDYFLPHNENNHFDETHIFRGQQNSNWELIPSLYRKPCSIGKYFVTSFEFFEKNFHIFYGDKRLNNIFGSSPDNVKLRAFKMYCFEKILLNEFIKSANKLNFHLLGAEKAIDIKYVFDSDISQMVKPLELDQDYSKSHITGMPDVIVPEPYVALAQHHGIPTKLLDFTVNPLAALFFASQNTGDEEEEEIAVYSTSLKDYYFDSSYIYYDRSKRDSSLCGMHGILRVPNSHNEYLYKQGGIFLYPKYPYSFFLEYGRYPNLEDHGKMINTYNGKENSSIRMYTLPGTEKPKLRKLLKRWGITKSSLMPTLDNVVQDLKADFLTKQDFHPYNY